MTAATFELTVEPRTVLGKGASRRLRRMDNKVPAIIYGDEKEPHNVMIEHRFITKALENEAFYSHILTLHEGSKKHKVVLKDLQRHPYKPQILHMDFMRINAKKAMIMHVPVHFIGVESCPGVKIGGMVTHHMVELEVRCLAKDLPEFLEVDLTNAELDQIIHLTDVKAPKGVEIMALVHHPENDLPIASIHRPKRGADTDSETSDTEDDSASGSEDKDSASKG